jgi:hypothetical protein
MYTHAKFVVKKDHTITDPSILGKGVRKGDGISPFYSKYLLTILIPKKNPLIPSA